MPLGSAFLGAAAGKALESFLGGAKQQTQVSQATTLSVAQNPIFFVGSGAPAGNLSTGSGGAGSASASASGAPQTDAPSFGQPALSSPIGSTLPGLNDITDFSTPPLEAGLFGGDPLILLLIGDAVLLFVVGGKGAK